MRSLRSMSYLVVNVSVLVAASGCEPDCVAATDAELESAALNPDCPRIVVTGAMADLSASRIRNEPKGFSIFDMPNLVDVSDIDGSHNVTLQRVDLLTSVDLSLESSFTAFEHHLDAVKIEFSLESDIQEEERDYLSVTLHPEPTQTLQVFAPRATYPLAVSVQHLGDLEIAIESANSSVLRIEEELLGVGEIVSFPDTIVVVMVQSDQAILRLRESLVERGFTGELIYCAELADHPECDG